MKLAEGSKVVAVSRAEKEEEPEDEGPAEAETDGAEAVLSGDGPAGENGGEASPETPGSDLDMEVPDGTAPKDEDTDL